MQFHQNLYTKKCIFTINFQTRFNGVSSNFSQDWKVPKMSQKSQILMILTWWTKLTLPLDKSSKVNEFLTCPGNLSFSICPGITVLPDAGTRVITISASVLSGSVTVTKSGVNSFEVPSAILKNPVWVISGPRKMSEI